MGGMIITMEYDGHDYDYRTRWERIGDWALNLPALPFWLLWVPAPLWVVLAVAIIAGQFQ